MVKPVCVLDIEVYSNYFLVMLRDIGTGGLFWEELYPGHVPDYRRLATYMNSVRLVTFNGLNFDMVLLSAFLNSRSDNAKLKEISNAIIENGFKSWQCEKKFGFKMLSSLDHIDLIEVAPGTGSLKIYGGRLHVPRMQDLPLEPSAMIGPEDRPNLRTYCANDLTLTEALYRTLLPQIELREALSKEYGIDLRSKSDAQIAEAVIAQEVSKITGKEVARPEIPPGKTYRYKAPLFVNFSTPDLQALLNEIQELDLVVVQSGAIELPKILSDKQIKIGQSVYRMGIGGLHSSEKSVTHRADAQTLLIDRDVTSYYPSIILRNHWSPPHMGGAFLKVYQGILDKRLAAKRAGDKVTAESLKITVNGSFGKLGSKWSKLYAPNLMLQTTLTGQLSLLMLIERLEGFGIPVVSANTDGIVIKCLAEDETLMHLAVASWEEATGFETEETRYAALYSRDVNNYIAVKEDGSVKLKGAYATTGLQKNPANEISILAAVRFLTKGTPIEKTVAECTDVRKFVTVRQVKGGAVKDGAYLGKAVRWYYSVLGIGPIQYKVNGYSVARSEGAMPCMDLPAGLPKDIDEDWYIAEAKSILEEVGA